MAKIGDIKQKFGKKHLNNRYIGSRYALIRKIQNSTEKFNGKKFDTLVIIPDRMDL